MKWVLVFNVYMDWILSRFDVAGATGAAGACLKRYTDPSFFKLEWASSELMKAQRAQREKKPHRDKVKMMVEKIKKCSTLIFL